jgi:uncharacterized protein (AIM24 family)
MPVTLNASTSSGLIATSDTSGNIELQNNGTTRLTVNSTGATITGTQSVSGDLSFNSGYGSSAVAYGCRAWVNFNGTGTVAIRASGNVSSITDNGTGNYTINFTNALADANYSYSGSHSSSSAGASSFILNNVGATAPTTTAARIQCAVSGADVDPVYVNCAFFR